MKNGNPLSLSQVLFKILQGAWKLENNFEFKMANLVNEQTDDNLADDLRFRWTKWNQNILLSWRWAVEFAPKLLFKWWILFRVEVWQLNYLHVATTLSAHSTCSNCWKWFRTSGRLTFHLRNFSNLGQRLGIPSMKKKKTTDNQGRITCTI